MRSAVLGMSLQRTGVAIGLGLWVAACGSGGGESTTAGGDVAGVDGADVASDVASDGLASDGVASDGVASDGVVSMDSSGGADSTSTVTPVARKVDVVLLVDTSTSMCAEKAALATAEAAFVARLDAMDGLDYRIAVVSQSAVAADVAGVFQARPATMAAFACSEEVIQPCLRPGAQMASLPASFTDQCSGADCGCSNLGAEWTCDAPATANMAVNCNGSVNTSCRRTCTSDADCDTAFVDAAAGSACAADPTACVYTCSSPAGNVEQSGCVRRPVAGACPEAAALRATLLADAGRVCSNGQTCDDAHPCAGGGACTAVTVPWVTRANAANALPCITTSDADQHTDAALEQGLNALYYAAARDADAPNAAQARQFVRDDALLVLMVVSDEDDCSTTDCGKDASGHFTCGAGVKKEDYGRCVCLGDTTQNGPLRSASEAVTMLQSLKPDPSQILVAVVDGDAPEGSGQDAAREAYHASKCGECADPADVHAQLWNTSICTTSTGRADDGRRYREVVQAFGENGIYTSVCSADPFASTFQALGDRIEARVSPSK